MRHECGGIQLPRTKPAPDTTDASIDWQLDKCNMMPLGTPVLVKQQRGHATTHVSKPSQHMPAAAPQVSGPVAIVAAGSDLARTDEAGLFQFAAIVNFNLAVVNILPVPGLDGGFLAFILLEAVRGGKKVDANVEKSVMASGILLLFVLGIGLVIRDTLNLF